MNLKSLMRCCITHFIMPFVNVHSRRQLTNQHAAFVPYLFVVKVTCEHRPCFSTAPFCWELCRKSLCKRLRLLLVAMMCAYEVQPEHVNLAFFVLIIKFYLWIAFLQHLYK